MDGFKRHLMTLPFVPPYLDLSSSTNKHLKRPPRSKVGLKNSLKSLSGSDVHRAGGGFADDLSVRV